MTYFTLHVRHEDWTASSLAELSVLTGQPLLQFPFLPERRVKIKILTLLYFFTKTYFKKHYYRRMQFPVMQRHGVKQTPLPFRSRHLWDKRFGDWRDRFSTILSSRHRQNRQLCY